MHPRQAVLLAQSEEITEKLMDRQATPVLWKYVDGDGQEFFLPSRRQNVHSPYSGKSAPQKPEKYQIPALGKELKDEAKSSAPGAPGPKTGQPKDKRKRAAEDPEWKAAATPVEATSPILWKYRDDDGGEFFLTVRLPTVKSPFSGKTLHIRPERVQPSSMGKELREDMNIAPADSMGALAASKLATAPVLWKYIDESGNEFFLTTRETTVRSPFSGRPIHMHPMRVQPSSIGQELKEEAAAPEELEGPEGCQACGGQLEPLGQLGNHMHYRCRDCGMDASI